MNKKNIQILLLIPFLASTFTDLCTNRIKKSKEDYKLEIKKNRLLNNKVYDVDKQRAKMIRMIRAALNS